MAERTERGVLNHLIEICQDGARGFRYAADLAKSPPVKELFLEIAGQRERFAADLLPHAQRLGGDAPAEGTAAGTLHRGWMAIKDTLTRHDEKALVTEAERGEGRAAEAYKDALQGVLPPTVRDLVEQQHLEIARTLERVRMLMTT
jgi:uncharacterized protein (TIGR02284 family)